MLNQVVVGVSTGSYRAVFLDRDGVINKPLLREGKPCAPLHIRQFEILPGVPEALIKFRKAGFLNVVVTNQPDISTGELLPEVMDEIHVRMMERLALDCIRVCIHVDAHNCECRKPRPGLLLQAAKDLDINLSASYMVGDRWRDVGAGARAGCKNFFIDNGYREKRPVESYFSVASLAAVADLICNNR